MSVGVRGHLGWDRGVGLEAGVIATGTGPPGLESGIILDGMGTDQGTGLERKVTTVGIDGHRDGGYCSLDWGSWELEAWAPAARISGQRTVDADHCCGDSGSQGWREKAHGPDL